MPSGAEDFSNIEGATRVVLAYRIETTIHDQTNPKVPEGTEYPRKLWKKRAESIGKRRVRKHLDPPFIHYYSADESKVTLQTYGVHEAGDIVKFFLSRRPIDQTSFHWILKEPYWSKVHKIIVLLHERAENGIQTPRKQDIIVSKDPEIFPRGQIVTLGEIEFRPDVLLVSKVPAPESAFQITLDHLARIIRRAVIRDQQFNPMLVLQLRLKKPQQQVEISTPIVSWDCDGK
jgi:hypothetical protein